MRSNELAKPTYRKLLIVVRSRLITSYRSSFLLPCFALLLGTLLAGCPSTKGDQATGQGPSSERPNIIFLMDDQHRWDALGFINTQVKTPTLNRLAQNGVFFRQAVCQAPMCVPSRNSLMLGLYPHQTGVFRNSGGLQDDELPNKTLAQYFQDAGYETAGFGKTHWGKYPTSTRGFETRYVSEIPEEGAIAMAKQDPAAKARYDAEVSAMGPGEENNLGYLGFTSELPEQDHRDGWITEQCQKYIRQREDDRPLFLYVSYMKPHAGHNVPAGYEDRYDLDSITYAQQPPWDEDYAPHAAGVNRRDMYVDYWKNAPAEDWKLMTMRYYANVTWIDDMMGRVLQSLDEKGLLDNALIVYTSDHGEMLGEHYYRFNKYNLYESSVRVPLILSGSALPSPYQGQTNNQAVELVDVMPTLLDFAGISPNRNLPGIDLLSSQRREASFSTLHERDGEAAFMWRTEDYKLILVFRRKEAASAYTEADIIGGELYDLNKDPREWNDLYDQEAVVSVQKEYTQELLDHLQSLKQKGRNGS